MICLSLGSCNKLPQTEWFKQTFISTDLKAGKSKIKVPGNLETD